MMLTLPFLIKSYKSVSCLSATLSVKIHYVGNEHHLCIGRGLCFDSGCRKGKITRRKYNGLSH